MSNSNKELHFDVMSLVGNLSLVVAGTTIFVFSVFIIGDFLLALLGGFMVGVPIGLLKRRFNGRGW